MKLTATELLKMQIIDEIIEEPLGGAHRNKEETILPTKKILMKYLEEFRKYTREEIFEHRKKKFLSIGRSKGFASSEESDKNLTVKESLLQKIILKLQKFKFQAIVLFFLLIAGLIYFFL